MKVFVLFLALVVTLFLVLMFCIGVSNGTLVWPIFGGRIHVLHIFGLSIIALSLLKLLDSQKWKQ